MACRALAEAADTSTAGRPAGSGYKTFLLQTRLRRLGAERLAENENKQAASARRGQGDVLAGARKARLEGRQASREGTQGKAGKPIDGLSPEQRFFAAFAQIWEQNIRPEMARNLALSDPHPLANYRVIGTVSNVPSFATAYQCAPAAPMVRKETCKIW